MKIAIISFPGTNRADDLISCLNFLGNYSIDIIGPQTTNLSNYKLIILPGGFSYGDCDGAGVKAAKQPVIKDLRLASERGAFILGICNGFQILTEAGLLPGNLIMNENKKFISKNVKLKICHNDNLFFSNSHKNNIIELPIAHFQGKYIVNKHNLQKLHQNKQIILQYIDNIANDSTERIAAVCNENKNILGIMPHPENAFADYHKSTDGAELFISLLKRTLN